MIKNKNTIKIITVMVSLFLVVSCGTQKDNGSNNVLINTKGTVKNEVEQKKDNGLFSPGKQEIVKLMLKSGPDIILKVDCNKYDEEGKKYCESEKAKMEKIKKEVTWESVFRQGSTYIKGYNCKGIKQVIGQKHCEEYKAKSLINDIAGSRGSSIAEAKAKSAIDKKVIEENLNCHSETRAADKYRCEEKNNVLKVISELEKIERSQRKTYDCKKFLKPELIAACKMYTASLK